MPKRQTFDDVAAEVIDACTHDRGDPACSGGYVVVNAVVPDNGKVWYSYEHLYTFEGTYTHIPDNAVKVWPTI